MKKLICYFIAVFLMVSVSMTAYAESRTATIPCPVCASDMKQLDFELVDVYWLQDAHEDHSDLFEHKIFNETWKCTLVNCGYMLQREYRTVTVLQCPFYG